MRVAPAIILSEQDRTRLETLAAAAGTPANVAQRARIILLAAEGVQNKMIAPRLGIGRAQVARWRERYVHSGLEGILHDLPRGAPPVKMDVARLALLTGVDGAGEPPAWSVRSLATELGVSPASVSRHWRAAGLAAGNARRTSYTPPVPFTGGAAEFVALYVLAPEHALVLAFDDSGNADSDVGTLRSLRTMPARQRSLAASLLTALRVLDGEQALTAHAPSGINRHENWLGFLQEVEAATPPDRHLWILADNHACHQHGDVQQWLRRHPRITVQLAPNAAGWLRMVQRFLRDARTASQAGFPAGIPETLAAIEAATRSRSATPCRWVREGATRPTTSDANSLLAGSRTVLPIASTKVLPPHGVRHLMPREALMGSLLQARRHRCVVIQGQAGSGKTSALMAWRKEMISLGYDVCWLSLSVEDNEPARFFDYLLASIAEADPAAARKATQLAGARYDEATVELRVISLINELARRQRDLVLMIDDLHHISDPRILQALQLLLDYAPPQLRVALASRTALGLSLERLRLQNLLAEFDMRHLRFSPEESARFLRDQLGSIAPGDAAALHELTDGWVAGLQLLAIGLRKQQPGSYPATKIRDARAFASFFEREVLVQLAPDDLDVLVRVSICQRFCAPLCAEILGQPQAVAQIKGRISRMVADHLFISVVGSHDHETWYRVHPLLRETLLGHLAARGEGEMRAMHAAAWRWFDARGHVDDAVLHAVSAGEPGAAASLVEGCALALLARGELNRVASLVRMLPEEEVRQRYPLHVVMAYMQLYARDFDALRASLDLLEAQRDALGANGRYSLCLLKAGLALQCDENDEAAALQDEIWDAPPDADEFAWHARANVLSWFLTQRGEHDLVRCVLEEADQRTRSRRSWLLGRCIHALSLARQGQIQQAGKIVREVLEEAECLGPGYVPVASMAAGLLADTLYELNETEAACQLLEPRIGMLERASLPEVVLRASVVLSNSHWLAGRRELALACLDRLEAYASRYALDRLLAEAMVLRLRRHLQRGQMEQAGFALERVEALALRHAGSGPEKSVQIARAAARAWIEMALYTRNFAGAQERIESLIAAGDQSPGAASLHMQLAIARLGLGAAQAARLDFIEAIGVGHRLGLSRTLLDAQEIVPDAIDALAREPLPDPVLEFYVQRLAQAHRSAARGHGHGDAGPEVDAIAMLSEREREILQLLAQAMSNKKIARILNVSAETVKWHLKNIYAKLGVGGRGGAAALLRDLIGPGQR